jgi:acetolactate synthase I/II/III large subunit
MLDLRNPELDFARMAEGMGGEASRAATTREFASQFADAMARRGPRLIEAVLNG